MKNKECMEIFYMTVDHKNVVDDSILEEMKKAYVIATERLDVIASIAEDMGVKLPDSLIYEDKAAIAACLNIYFKCGKANEAMIATKMLRDL